MNSDRKAVAKLLGQIVFRDYFDLMALGFVLEDLREATAILADQYESRMAEGCEGARKIIEEFEKEDATP